jgi:hypothetical protein
VLQRPSNHTAVLHRRVLVDDLNELAHSFA